MDKELLSAASSGSRLQMAGILKRNDGSYDINCFDADGHTPLFLASREGKEEAVQMLLDAGSDVTLRCNKNGDTPLNIACWDGHVKVVSKLLAAGSDVDSTNYNGWTPLIHAAYYNYHDIVRVLVAHKANLNLNSQAGCAALLRASSNGSTESARVLIEAGADINLANSSGNTPLSVAARNGHIAIVKLLLEAGALVDTVDTDGLSPLHQALDYDKEEVVELLVTLGKADTSQPDPAGRRPVSMAKSDKVARLIENVEQTRRITESLAELQVSQPQLTQLTHPMQQATENGGNESNTTEEAPSTTVSLYTSTETSLTTTTDAPLTPNSGMTAISTAALSRLTSLAEASPLTIECLKQFGASVAQAERDYDLIRRDPSIYEYYLFFIQAVSSAVLACQSIASGMIDDARVSSAENFMELLDTAAQSLSWMGAPIILGIGKVLVKNTNNMHRQRTVRRITTFFPSIDSHKYIEILSRELTIFLTRDIHNIMREAKRAPKQSILDRVMKVVEWLDTATNLSVVQGLACGHAALLVDRMMEEERPFPVQLENVNMLMQWATEKELSEIDNRGGSRPSTPLSSPTSSQPQAAQIADEPVCPVNDEKESVSAAEQKEIDERIQKLEHRLSMERQQRAALEQKQASELNALKKQMKGLEAVNNIFSGINAAGGLVGAQSAESVHKTIEDHLRGQAIQQSQQGEILRELTVRVDLLIEDNHLHSPVEIEVPGSSQGSLVYSQKSAPMGEWVNSKMSYTADGASPTTNISPVTPITPITPVTPVSPVSNKSTSNTNKPTNNVSHKSSPSPVSRKSQRTSKARSTDWTKSDIETDAAGFIVDTPGCCVLS